MKINITMTSIKEDTYTKVRVINEQKDINCEYSQFMEMVRIKTLGW